MYVNNVIYIYEIGYYSIVVCTGHHIRSF